MIRVFRDHQALSEAAAEHIVAIGKQAIDKRRVFNLVLSGGKTPVGTWHELVRILSDDSSFWLNTRLFWGDERCVPPDDPESNYLMAKRDLIGLLKTPPREVQRLKAEVPDLDAEIRRYAEVFPSNPDLLILGCASDGHVASLFPGSPLLDEKTERFALAEAPVPPRRRISMTPVVIASARSVLVLVSGSTKVETVRRVFARQGSVHETPARLVRDADWYIDRDALGELGGSVALETEVEWVT